MEFRSVLFRSWMKTAQAPVRTDRGSQTGALRTVWLRVVRSGDKPREMRYISTRGNAPVLNFEEVTLAGLASDGGLYLPESWPTLSTEVLRSLRTASYVETAVAVMMHFVGDALSADELRSLCPAA